jgi:hypothetical protein
MDTPTRKKITFVVTLVVAGVMLIILGAIAYDVATPVKSVDRQVPSPSGDWIAVTEYVQYGWSVSPVYQTVVLQPLPHESMPAQEILRLEISTTVKIVGVDWNGSHQLAIKFNGSKKDLILCQTEYAGITINCEGVEPSGT